VLHPIRWRIVQRAMGREVTTADLRRELPDVAPATLYRQIAALLEGGLLRVVREEPMRGAVERTYALNELEEHRRTGQQEAVGLSAERYRAALAMVLAQIAVDFERAVERGDLPEREDELSMGQTALYVRPDQLPQLTADLMAVLTPYLEKPAGDLADEPARRMLLSIIAIPDA
jgi:hypothetical protein